MEPPHHTLPPPGSGDTAEDQTEKFKSQKCRRTSAKSMSSGNGTVIGLMNSLTLLGLPKTEPVDIPAWSGGGGGAQEGRDLSGAEPP